MKRTSSWVTEAWDAGPQNKGIEIPWTPIEGPQMDALGCEADELFFGGQAGGGKTYLLIGLAATEHHRSLIMRRQLVQFREIQDKAMAVYGAIGKFNAKDNVWALQNDAKIEFGAADNEMDIQKYAGRPHDLLAFDEICHFTEFQYRFLSAWNRSSRPNQRVRIVATGNPPATEDGRWVLKYWGAWLDPNYQGEKAESGEVRYFITVTDPETGAESQQEVPNKSPVPDPSGRRDPRNPDKPAMLNPVSRCFIRSKLSDNPYQDTADYAARLDALPEPLRSQLRDGNFSDINQTDAYQVIKRDWVEKAVLRWRDVHNPSAQRMDAIGVDVARGGADVTTIAVRRGAYIERIIRIPGRLCPDGNATVSHILSVAEGKPTIYIDASSVGSGPYDKLVELNQDVVPVIASKGSNRTDKAKIFNFKNMRAEMWWRMRELLDPDGGFNIALPPDAALADELCAPKWKIVGKADILIQSKDELRDQLGRSTDAADAVISAFYQADEKNLILSVSTYAKPDGLNELAPKRSNNSRSYAMLFSQRGLSAIGRYGRPNKRGDGDDPPITVVK